MSSEWDHVKPGGIDRYLLINTKLRWQSQWTQEKSADKSPLVYKNVCYSRHPDCSSFGEHLALLRSLSRKQKKPPCYHGSLKASLAWCQLAMVGMAAVGNILTTLISHAARETKSSWCCSQKEQGLFFLLTSKLMPAVGKAVGDLLEGEPVVYSILLCCIGEQFLCVYTNESNAALDCCRKWGRYFHSTF